MAKVYSIYRAIYYFERSSFVNFGAFADAFVFFDVPFAFFDVTRFGDFDSRRSDF
jgi:hypothetical protein